MRLFWKLTIAITLAAVGLCGAFAQDDFDDANAPNVILQNVADKTHGDGSRWLTPDDRISLLAAALDARVRREAEPDCSHLVHAIYEAAGLPYAYAPSSDIYSGIENFHRVDTPRPGDLVVWRGHVGMVIKPSQHIFFSYLSSGPGTDDYEAAYWKHRGRPRFYRYIKKEIR
jgi:cell wall-associated NlpC family hydrolase